MSILVSFPLFHGTASIFAQSILAHGLGARNPVNDLRGFSCLFRLYEMACKHLEADSAWETERISVEPMVNQRITGGNMNFKHGATYCSPSQCTAVRYATSNAYGSELISTCVSLYKRLRKTTPSALTGFEAQFPEITSLACRAFSPLLIELANVRADALLTEHGENADEDILFVQNAKGPVDRVMLEQTNFQLTTPVPPSDIQIYTVRHLESTSAQPRYELHPYVQQTPKFID